MFHFALLFPRRIKIMIIQNFKLIISIPKSHLNNSFELMEQLDTAIIPSDCFDVSRCDFSLY